MVECLSCLYYNMYEHDGSYVLCLNVCLVYIITCMGMMVHVSNALMFVLFTL